MITLGVFDSGVGGLSVLRDLLTELPGVRCVYVADNAFAPYGERDVATLQDRARKVTAYLRRQHAVNALVIACNTATAHAIDALRIEHPDLPIVGVEPALKTASALSASGHIGVLATRATLSSQRFERLRCQVESHSAKPLHFWPQACDGLADAIERDRLEDIQILCERYMAALLGAAPQAQQIDTVVLGCTHYPFAIDALQSAAQKEAEGQVLRLLDTGLPVAKRARDLLMPLASPISTISMPPLLLSTGDPAALTKAGQRWIDTALTARNIEI